MGMIFMIEKRDVRLVCLNIGYSTSSWLLTFALNSVFDGAVHSKKVTMSLGNVITAGGLERQGSSLPLAILSLWGLFRTPVNRSLGFGPFQDVHNASGRVVA